MENIEIEQPPAESLISQHQSRIPAAIAIMTVIIFSIALAIIMHGHIFSTLQSRSSSLQTSTETLDGMYLFDSKSPYVYETVEISSSTASSLHFTLSESVAGNDGGYDGTAVRVSSTTSSSSVFVSRDDANSEQDINNGICHVMIEFIDPIHLQYVVEEFEPGAQYTDQQKQDCESNLGVGVSFDSHVVFKKNGMVTLPTIKQLGFTDADIAFLDILASSTMDGATSGLMSEAQRYLNVNDDDPTLRPIATKLDTSQIPDSVAYAINTPNIGNGNYDCNYTKPDVGYGCLYVAFMKDTNSHYWILGGSSSDLPVNDGAGFTYATNDAAWKSTLPYAFAQALSSIGVPRSSVVFKK